MHHGLSGSSRGRIGFHALLACLLVIALGSIVAGCGSSASAGDSGGSAASDPSAGKLEGIKTTPPQPAAPLRLRNYLGKTVDLRQFRGKAVLLTFIYTHCPDTCPLIVSHLRTAQHELGAKAGDLQIVAVSADPRGDTPKTVSRFLKEHGMTGRMQYLIGSRKQLGKVWKDWNIVAKPAKSGRDLVEHSAEIYGISAGGDVTTLYPADFKPSQIVNDVPILASR